MRKGRKKDKRKEGVKHGIREKRERQKNLGTGGREIETHKYPYWWSQRSL